MTMSPEFRDYLLDQLEPFGPVAAKRMFGGGGLFRDGTMFGLIADDVLFLKVDEKNQADFEDRGMDPFTYDKKSRKEPVQLSYWECPTDVLEDPDELCQWAASAWEAARRSGTDKKKKKTGAKA
jgi:DNA transformation protein